MSSSYNKLPYEDPDNIGNHSRRVTTSKRRVLFDRACVNLESHQLIWLTERDCDFRKHTIEELRKIVDYTKTFTNRSECQRYIGETYENVTFLMCSNAIGKQFVPQMHHYQNIRCIYIYCQGEDKETESDLLWTSNYSKVHRVYTNSVDLINDLRQDVAKYLNTEKEHGILAPDKIRKDKSTEEYRSWHIAFIDIVCYIPYPEGYFQQFCSSIKQYYAENAVEIRLIEEFETNYKSNEALQWYTRPTFLYRIMNKALRQQKVETILLFGFFIQDMYRQLQVEHERFKSVNSTVIRAYRGQVMSLDEIQNHRPCANIILNSFFSTTLDRSVALFFLDAMAPSNDELQRVLFEIELSGPEQDKEQLLHQIRSRPFADISHLSSIVDESEILFMIGTRYIILYKGYDDKEKLWTVKLALNYDNDVKVEEYFTDGNKKRTLKNCISALPTYPSDYNREESSEIISNIFIELMNLYPAEKWIRAYELCYRAKYSARNSFSSKEDIQNLMQICNGAIQLFTEYTNDSELNFWTDIGDIHFEIGNHYNNIEMVIQHYNTAVSHYRMAMEKSTTGCERIHIFNQLVSIYESKYYCNNENNYLIAIDYKEKCIEEMSQYKFFSKLDIGKKLVELSLLYDSACKTDKALDTRLRALEMIPGPSSNIAFLEAEFYGTLILNSLIQTYTKDRHDFSVASQYLLMKHAYLLKKPTADAICLGKGYIELSDMYLEIDWYDIAAEHLTTAIKLYKDSDIYEKIQLVTRTEEKLASVYMESKKYSSAYEHLHEALIWSERETISFRKWSKTKTADTHEKLARICERLGQQELACEHSNKSLELYPELSSSSKGENQMRFTTVQNKMKDMEDGRLCLCCTNSSHHCDSQQGFEDYFFSDQQSCPWWRQKWLIKLGVVIGSLVIGSLFLKLVMGSTSVENDSIMKHEYF